MSLVWNEKKKWANKQGEFVQINEKPNLSFKYKYMEYNPTENISTKTSETGKVSKLSEKDIESINSFLENLDITLQKAILGVDSKGRFLERVSPFDKDVDSFVWETPSNKYDYVWDSISKSWITGYPVDIDGNFITINGIWNDNFHIVVDQPPVNQMLHETKWDFENKIWIDLRDIEVVRDEYLDALEQLYFFKLNSTVNSHPLNEFKYKEKFKEALKFKEAGYPKPDDTEYPYIYYQSLYTKDDPKSIADSIITKHKDVNRKINVAALDGIRIAVKNKIKNATNVEDIKSSLALINTFSKVK